MHICTECGGVGQCEVGCAGERPVDIGDEVKAAVVEGRVLWSNAFGWLLRDAQQPDPGVDIVDVGDDAFRQQIVALYNAGLIAIDEATGKAYRTESAAW